MSSLSSLPDPASAFLEAASAPRHASHTSGTLEAAQTILERYPAVATTSIYAAAVLADEQAVRSFLEHDKASATLKGGVYGWDALTYLCFSRYLRLDGQRSEAFVRTARLLLDAGASAETGWHETIHDPTPRLTLESAIYGAAAIARHPTLTSLLLERGADPNDEETPYHVPESYDNTILQILLESGKLNEVSLACMLVRKADTHDESGMRLLLAHGANPNVQPQFGVSALHQALRRDNRLSIVKLLLDHGGDPTVKSNHGGLSAAQIAARRGRADVLRLFERYDDQLDVSPLDDLIAAFAQADRKTIDALLRVEPDLLPKLMPASASLLAEFAGNGHVEGLQCLLDFGVPVDAPYGGDSYFDIPAGSTALHVAAWRAQPTAVALLVKRGALVDAKDANDRSPLQLAIRACVDSYWMNRRTPESVRTLLDAGASRTGIEIPTGYEEVDRLLFSAS